MVNLIMQHRYSTTRMKRVRIKSRLIPTAVLCLYMIGQTVVYAPTVYPPRVEEATFEISHLSDYTAQSPEGLTKVESTPVQPSRGATRVITARVTAYAPFDNKSGMCADSDPSVTSIGLKPGKEYIAVDPKKIPYGTKVIIPGYGEVEAGDTGGALRAYDGVAIDVFMDTYEEAIQWGVQYLEVEVYD